MLTIAIFLCLPAIIFYPIVLYFCGWCVVGQSIFHALVGLLLWIIGSYGVYKIPKMLGYKEKGSPASGDLVMMWMIMEIISYIMLVGGGAFLPILNYILS